MYKLFIGQPKRKLMNYLFVLYRQLVFNGVGFAFVSQWAGKILVFTVNKKNSALAFANCAK